MHGVFLVSIEVLYHKEQDRTVTGIRIRQKSSVSQAC